MSWRLDWILLATGLIAFGMTLIREGRSELLLLLEGEGSTEGLLPVLLGGYLVPALLLGAFVLRLGLRIVTRRWK